MFSELLKPRASKPVDITLGDLSAQLQLLEEKYSSDAKTYFL